MGSEFFTVSHIPRHVRHLTKEGYVLYHPGAGTFDLDAPEGRLTDELLDFLDTHWREFLPELRRQHMAKDPRPDLAEDSSVWGRLLSLAYGRDGTDPGGLAGTLHGLRCMGVSLETVGGNVSLRPGEMEPADYHTEKLWRLAPHAEPLIQLLDGLGGAGM